MFGRDRIYRNSLRWNRVKACDDDVRIREATRPCRPAWTRRHCGHGWDARARRTRAWSLAATTRAGARVGPQRVPERDRRHRPGGRGESGAIVCS